MSEKTEIKEEYLSAKKVTKRKKIIVFIVTFILLILICGSYFIYDNYKFGQDLYDTACRMSVQNSSLIDSIDDLEKEFENTDHDPDYAYINSFRAAIASMRSWFGYEDLPFMNDVRAQWSHRIEEIFRENLSDEDLKNLFTNKKKPEEITVFKNQFIFLNDSLLEFQDSYTQTPVWKRYFVSWKNERNILSEKVRVLQSKEK